MLSERAYRALTAFVDGELNPGQRKAVLRLVRRSSEARKRLRQLQTDSEKLKALPKKRLRLDFSEQVVKTITQRRLDQRRPLAPKPQPWHARPVWGSLAAAASVLFMIGFSSYLYFLGMNALENNSAAVATNPSGDLKADQKGDIQGSNPLVKNNGPGDEKENNTVVQGNNTPKDNHNPNPMEPRPSEPTELASPVPKMELFGPHPADVNLPEVQRLGQLDIGKLREVFQKDSGFRVELPCMNSSRAFDRLQATFKARGLNLMLDGGVQTRLKQPQWHTNYVVFTEELTADEMVQLLEQIAGEDKKASTKQKTDLAFDGLIITRMDQNDRKELGDLLGIDTKQVQVPRTNGPLGLDPRTPISEVTTNQVVQALSTGQGSAVRGTEPPKTEAKKVEPHGILLPFNPVRLGPGSVEVKKFLDGRKPLKTGAVQILLVVREVKG